MATIGLVIFDRFTDIDLFLHWDLLNRPLTRVLMKDAGYLKTLALDPSRQLVGSQCSGALVLAASGLLTGRKATTYPTAVDQLREFGAEPIEEPFVLHDDANIATAAGCLAGTELSRWILTRLINARVAEKCITSASAIGNGLDFPKPLDTPHPPATMRR